MAWFPGNEKYFNQWLSPLITRALGAGLSKTVLVESAQHPGLFSARYDDVRTLSLDVRPRLQTFAPTGPRSNNSVVSVGRAAGKP